ncbi:MAG: glutathione S-transferase family protein [Gammaproteobacteria bacterium]|nr:glutathione S-transferase family protein [Gammaproteobacteria bacterium]
MGLKIFGFAQSRTFRTLWMAEELRLAKGIEYSHDGRVFSNQEDKEFLMTMNPMGKVPVIDDEGFVLFESMAINLYLAKKHDFLAPRTLEQEARALQWSFWAMTAVDSQLLDYLKFKLGIMGVQKNELQAVKVLETLARPFSALNSVLTGTTYLLGDEFSVADLNVASVFMWARMGQVPMSQYPQVESWVSSCLGREALSFART